MGNDKNTFVDIDLSEAATLTIEIGRYLDLQSDNVLLER